MGQVEKKNLSVFSHIASPLDLHVEEDGEDHQDPNDDRDPDHLGLISSSCFHKDPDHGYRVEDVGRLFGEIDLHKVSSHLEGETSFDYHMSDDTKVE